LEWILGGAWKRIAQLERLAAMRTAIPQRVQYAAAVPHQEKARLSARLDVRH
jgi:hypothetical protein